MTLLSGQVYCTLRGMLIWQSLMYNISIRSSWCLVEVKCHFLHPAEGIVDLLWPGWVSLSWFWIEGNLKTMLFPYSFSDSLMWRVATAVTMLKRFISRMYVLAQTGSDIKWCKWKHLNLWNRRWNRHAHIDIRIFSSDVLYFGTFFLFYYFLKGMVKKRNLIHICGDNWKLLLHIWP